MARIGTLPYVFQDGAGNTAYGSQVNADFNAIVAQVDGNIDQTNLVDGAVTTAKLATGAVGTSALTDGSLSAAKFATLPHARVYNNAHISVPNATATTLTFNSERWDTELIHDPITDAGRLTCKTAGLYEIKAQVEFAVSATGIRILRLQLNTATTIAEVRVASSGGTYPTTLVIPTDYRLAVNDHVTASVYHEAGGPLNVNYTGNLSPEFSMRWAGP